MLRTVLLTPPLSPEQRMGMLAEGGAIMPSLGLLYIAAFLRKEGLSVSILDAESLGLDTETTIHSIAKQNPDILGITATTLSIISAIAVAQKIKTIIPHIRVFMGGPHVTAMPRETMESFQDIDGCVLGDGEISFARIIHNINNGLEIGQDIDGLVWRKGNEILINPKKEHLKDLDILPFPAWDLLKGFPEYYRPPFHSYKRLPVANIITTRGCPFACSFCDRSVFGNKVYSHSVEYIMEMVEHLIKDFGIREISIKDDTFLLSPERVVNFCRQLRKKRLDIVWSCNSRVNLVNDIILKEMKSARCWMISYGIESGSPQMLRKMAKGITKKEILDALRLTRKHGIVSKGFFMLGVPGETVETLKQTQSFINELPLDELNINFFTPFPGTRLFREVIEEGFNPDFSRMNMLEPVYIPKGLTEKDLRRYQKRMIYSFYLKLSKIGLYLWRASKDFHEFKRLLRMGKMFIAVISSGLVQKTRSN
ncbi:MAG: radical SAM protein [Candidatus Ratteibacteria bacterium]|nr:radical SAM protein [Candidatus Ratteibacteria bacterium]